MQLVPHLLPKYLTIHLYLREGHPLQKDQKKEWMEHQFEAEDQQYYILKEALFDCSRGETRF